MRIKQSIEKEIRYELIEIQSLCEKQQQKISGTQEKVGEWTSYYNVVMRKGFNAMQLAIIDHHIQKLTRYREQLEISLDVLERKKNDVIVQYNEIKKEVKIMEHLRDKKRGEYYEEMTKEEANIADEMSTLRYARQKVVA